MSDFETCKVGTQRTLRETADWLAEQAENYRKLGMRAVPSEFDKRAKQLREIMR